MTRRSVWCAGLCLACFSVAALAVDAPFLWRVQGGGAPHYIMGSVHVLPASAYPLPAALRQAYADTEELVLEADPAALSSDGAREHMLRAATAGEGLGSEIDAELHEQVRARARALELPPEICDPFRAWFCALTLGLIEFQRAGMDPNLGLDQHFYRQALAARRPMSWLETPQTQFELFIGMDAEMARQFLASSLEDFQRPELQPAALIQLWRRNDTQAMARFVTDTAREFPGFHQRMMSQRNAAWAEKLAPRLQDARPLLIVVGAGHLVGPDNLLDTLSRRGLKVRAVAPGAPR